MATNSYNMRILFYKIIYFPFINLLIRSTLRLINKVLKKPIRTAVSGIVTYTMPDGKQFRLSTNESCFVSHKLYWDNPINYEFTPIFIDLIPHCHSFFDVGANIGYFTVLAKIYNPDIQVHAFEPSEGPFYYLAENIKLNHSRQSQGFKTALAGMNGIIQFFDVVSKYSYLKYHLNGSSSTQNETGIQKPNQYNVEAITLDTFVETHQIHSLDLIKMDTECTEQFILQKGHATIEKFKPIIISEVYPEIEDEFEVEIKKHDYQIYQYLPDGLRHIQSFKETNLAYKGAGTFFDRNFFLVPTEKVAIIQKHIII